MTEQHPKTRFDVVSLGETMLRMSVPIGARLDDARSLDLEIGGAESNLAVALARIGRRTGWVSRLPDHALGNAVLRTLQFLRSPSMLRDYNRVHAAAGGQIDPTGEHYESLLPKSVQVALYRIALGRGFYDAVVDRFIVTPVVSLARFLSVFEPRFHSAPDKSPPAAEAIRSSAL